VVNTAARLQSAAPVNGVLVGEETWRSTRDAIEYEETEARDAKGKPHPVPVRPRSTQGERQLGGTFVGRGRELRLLHDIWKNVRDDRTPHLVTIVGPAGTGKTRLGVEFADAIRKQGGLVVRGRSLPYREKSAYGAFASHVKQLCKIFESDSRDRAAEKLHETVDSLIDGLHTGAQAADRESLFFSVRCFIEAVARNEPTVLVFEDLHWADGSLLDLVELLAERLRDLPILLLVLARPELVDLRPSWGGGLPASTNLPLGPLTQDDARRLALERLAQDADAAREE